MRFIGSPDGRVEKEPCNFELRTELGSRKRQRVDVEQEDRVEKDGYKPSSYIRDPDFYVGDGVQPTEIVVRVQDTLFKVPRKVLEVAKNLTLPSPSKRHGPHSPWELAWTFKPRDTMNSEPKELFRDLLWLLRAMANPATLSKFPQEDTEAHRIFQVGGFVRDLGIAHLTLWIQDLAVKASQTQSFMNACSTEIFEKLYDIAHEMNDMDTQERLVKHWAKRVFHPEGGGLPAVPAILFAEQYGASTTNAASEGLKELMGVAYYMHLVFNVPDLHVLLKDGLATSFRAHLKLGQPQRVKLLGGFYSLVSFWKTFRENPLVLPSPSGDNGCSRAQHTKCNAVWRRRWSLAIGWERIMRVHSADVLGLIKCLRDQLANDDETKTGLTPACRQAGLDLLTRKCEEMKENLSLHFIGV